MKHFCIVYETKFKSPGKLFKVITLSSQREHCFELALFQSFPIRYALFVKLPPEDNTKVNRVASTNICSGFIVDFHPVLIFFGILISVLILSF